MTLVGARDQTRESLPQAIRCSYSPISRAPKIGVLTLKFYSRRTDVLTNELQVLTGWD